MRVREGVEENSTQNTRSKQVLAWTSEQRLEQDSSGWEAVHGKSEDGVNCSWRLVDRLMKMSTKGPVKHGYICSRMEKENMRMMIFGWVTEKDDVFHRTIER